MSTFTDKQIYDLNNMNVAAQNVQLGTLLNNVAITDSPELTGTPTAPTATAGTNTTQIATTAFVQNAVSGKADSASPALTGTPTAPTAEAGTDTTQIATTAFVQAAVAGGGGVFEIVNYDDSTMTAQELGEACADVWEDNKLPVVVWSGMAYLPLFYGKEEGEIDIQFTTSAYAVSGSALVGLDMYGLDVKFANNEWSIVTGDLQITATPI